MVKNRQTSSSIETLTFANATKKGFDFEALDLTELIDRIGIAQFSIPHRLTFFQVFWLIAGEATEEIDFVPYRMAPGQISFLLPGQVQRLFLSPLCRGRLFLFAPSFLAVPPSGIAPVVESNPLLGRAMDALFDEYTSSAFRELLFHELTALLLRLQRQSDRATGAGIATASDARQLAHRFQNLIETTFAQHRSVSLLANQLGCTEKTLHRACLAATGLSPKTLIQQRVALEAKRILAHTGEPIKSIAPQLGFTEPTNFVKFFQRVAGELPSVFRKRVQAGTAQTVTVSKSPIHEPQLT